MGKLIAINISEQRGTPKKPVSEALLVKGWGIEGDAHGGDWHRQVSLLSLERIEEFNRSGAGVQYGDFGENLVISGFDFKNLPVGTSFRIGEAVLDSDRQGMSFALHDIPAYGRMHHAKRRCFCRCHQWRYDKAR